MNTALPAPDEQQPARKPRISKRLRLAVDLWISGKAGTRKAAAEKANLRYEYFCRALKKDHVREFVRERAEQNLTDATLRASSRVRELLEGNSEHVASKVALRLLESGKLISPAGSQAPAVSITNYNPGYRIILNRREEPSDEPIDVTPTQGDAA